MPKAKQLLNAVLHALIILLGAAALTLVWAMPRYSLETGLVYQGF